MVREKVVREEEREIADFESERREKRHKLKAFWEKKLEETAKELEEKKGETEMKEEKDEKEKPFFRCKEDKEAQSKRDFEDAQADADSRCMRYVREHANKWHNKTFYTLHGNLWLAKRGVW